MSYWKEVAIRRMNGWTDDPDDDIIAAGLETYAALLGGEVEGNYIRCPSPGRRPDDRSCFVRVDGPGRFYVYSCEGSQAAAYAYLRQRLKLAPGPLSTDTGPFALRLLNQTVATPGTLVETYLRNRGLTGPIPSCLHFHGECLHKPTGGYRPAMVAERTSLDGSVVAIHRTYLRRDGGGKADVNPARMDLGPAAGTAIRLSPLADDLMVGEGIETTLAAMQMFDLPGWAAGSTGAMDALKLPASVRSVIILADNDDAGNRAARQNAQRWLREGKRVRIRHAPIGNDFNDTLIARVSP
jgi:putative DNA primase/helicase